MTNPADYLHNEWWEMVIPPNPKREAQLRQDDKDVRNAMIYQDYLAGMVMKDIANAYNLSRNHVWLIIQKEKVK